ncbi:hypothetical protein MNBD_NITROSPINAE01-198 [hydrothermal vent metagenome]|uniref:Uncharacterized protein n=1 Tax=hydrothermal vent metagenome TaxID=652676 RepID=A0A3B1CL51_9ZZZZ
MPDSIFLVGFALLLTHELDAIGRHEWRIFPLVRRLEDFMAHLGLSLPFEIRRKQRIYKHFLKIHNCFNSLCRICAYNITGQ